MTLPTPIDLPTPSAFRPPRQLSSLSLEIMRALAANPTLAHHSTQETSEFAAGVFRRVTSENMRAFLLSLTYKASALGTLFTPPLTSNKAFAMASIFTDVYKIILQRTVHAHKFNLPPFRPLQPYTIAAIDAPGSKVKSRQKSRVPSASVPSTLHHHAIIVADAEHVAPKLDQLCGTDTLVGLSRLLERVRTSDLRSVAPTLEDVLRTVTYALNYPFRILKRTDPALANDAWLVLPTVESLTVH